MVSAYSELAGELAAPTISPIDPGDIDYVTERRKLLGPIADISHPEFGRENRPDETFQLIADVTHPDEKHFVVNVVSRVLDDAGVEVYQACYADYLQG